MLPILNAEAALHEVNCLGVGTGAFAADARRSVLRAWHTQAGVVAARRRAPAGVAAAGIGVRLVPRAPRADVCTTTGGHEQ